MPTSSTERSAFGERINAVRSLVAVPVRSGHLRYLDGWRGICILLVLIGHYSSVGRIANAGVEFFFVLSGSLMAELLVFKRQEIGFFLRRRVARVFPALAAYVLIVGTALNVSLWLSGMPLKLASPIAALFYFHNYLPHKSVVPLFEHTWSLAVEEHSYLLLVGIVVAARRRPLLAAAIAFAISALAVANAYRLLSLPYSGGQFIEWRTDVRAASVLLSFALCIVFRLLKLARLPGWAAAAAAVAAVAAMLIHGLTPIEFAACSLLAAFVVNSLTYCKEQAHRSLGNPVLVWFGTLSFSIYLWQQLFTMLWHAGVPIAPCFAMTLTCALMSFRLVENPARDYLNARWTRTPAPRDDFWTSDRDVSADAARPIPFGT